MTIKVGVGVIVINNNNQVLLGRRTGNHGHGTWAFPGGHLEYAESPFDCAMRETKEETGLIITNLKQGPWVNTVFEDSHYVTLFVSASHTHGTPVALEPDKCESWYWFEWSNLPRPLFKTVESFVHLHVHTKDREFA